MASKMSAGKKIPSVDFVLIVLTGNLTRYINMRPIVDAMRGIKTRWYPIRTWVEGDWLRFLPGNVRLRLRHLLDSAAFFVRRPADAVVMHALDTYSIYGAWHRLWRLKTVLVNNPDDIDYDKQGLRLRLLANAVRQTSLFVPWSHFVAKSLVDRFPEAASRIHVLHPGIPLQDWPLRDPPEPSSTFRLLFVGGDAPRKGLDTLLEAYEHSLQDRYSLDVVSQEAYLTPAMRSTIARLPGVKLHIGLTPGSALLKDLYARADAFVLPTRNDASPWAAIEALATGVPVVISPMGGIPEIVLDGTTGLIVPPENPAAIVAAVTRLRDSPELRAHLVAHGRQHIEENFDGHRNTAKLIELVTEAIDRSRQN